MSAETNDWLRNNVLQGYAVKRGAAWHAINGTATVDDNGELTHYDGPIPLEDVKRRLFNFEIMEAPITFDAIVNGVETKMESTTDKVIYRSDTGLDLGHFKNGFVIHQYTEWLIEKASHIMDTSEGQLECASALLLAGGAVAAVTYELPETIETPEGVNHRPFFLSATSVNGTLSSTDTLCFGLVVCDNTLQGSLSEQFAKDHMIKTKHSKYSQPKISEHRSALGLMFSGIDAFNAEIKALCETPVSGKQFNEFLKLVAPIDDEMKGRALTLAENKRQTMLDLYVDDARVSPWQGSAFGVLQMTNTYEQHLTGTKSGTVRAERNMIDVIKGDKGKLAQSDSWTIENLFKILENA